MASSDNTDQVLSVEQDTRKKSSNAPSNTTSKLPDTKKVVVTPPMDISSGKEESSETKFWQVKSYANILSEGLSKVKGVFTKSKDNIKSSDEGETKPAKLTSSAHFKTAPPAQSKSAPSTLKVSKIHTEIKSTPNPHPDIPGLLFKHESERKNSKKKRRSKNLESEKVTEELSNISNIENVNFQQEAKEITENVIKIETSQQTASIDNVEVIINKDIKLEKPSPREFTKASSTSGSTNNTLRKRSKKKLSKEFHEVKKFNDEVDQALYEIQLMEEEKAKRKSFHGGEVSIQTLIKPTTIKPKRGSKKSRKMGRALPYQSSLDEGNAADDELEKDTELEAQPILEAEKSLEVTMDDIKESQVYIEKCDEVISFKSDEIMCLPEDETTPRSSPLDVISPLGITEHLSSGIEMGNIDNCHQESVESSNVSLNQSIDTIEEMSSEEERESKDTNESQITNKQTEQETEAKIGDNKHGLQYSQDWMIDDVGDIESSDEEPGKKIKKSADEKINDNVEDSITSTTKESKVEEKDGLIYSQDWMIEDVGAIEDTDDEQEVTVATVKTVIEKIEEIKVETKNVSDKVDEKKVLEYSQDWMIDDVGVIEDSDEEQEVTIPTAEMVIVNIEEKNVASSGLSETTADEKEGLEYSQDWMIDDVGVIEDSDDEQDVTVATAKTVTGNIEETSAVAETKAVDKKGLEYSKDWKIDDVGAIEDSDDEQEVTVVIANTVIGNIEEKNVETSAVAETKAIEKKGLEYSQDWMIDDVGAIEDSDDEQEVTVGFAERVVGNMGRTRAAAEP